MDAEEKESDRVRGNKGRINKEVDRKRIRKEDKSMTGGNTRA